jgi:ATP phosphoribosyltransferase
MDRKRLRIAIQKSGRLADSSLDLLRSAGLAISKSKDGLYYRAEDLPIDLMLVRDDDIPRLVDDGVAELGIVGLNVLGEYNAANGVKTPARPIKSLGFSKCRLAIAVPESASYDSIADLEGLRIATSYTGLLRDFLLDQGTKAHIVAMRGSVEVAPRLDIADAICDLVSTGSTLEANGLKEVQTVLESEAVLIGTKQPQILEKQQTHDRFLKRIVGVLEATETKYVMLNAPASALSQIKDLLPGADAPTVIPLDDRGEMIAVHAVCRESVFWETMEQLKAVGASSVLVLPIEKMMN